MELFQKMWHLFLYVRSKWTVNADTYKSLQALQFLGALQRGASSFHIVPQRGDISFLSSNSLIEFFAY